MFMESLLAEDNRQAFTENGATALRSTKSYVLDLFSKISAMRDSTEQDILSLWKKAYAEDSELAMKVLFNSRDIRGGQGERKTFRIILKYLSVNNKAEFLNALNHIAFYGRWDDMFFDKDILTASFDYVNTIFKKPAEYTFEELTLFKWMPSVNASSPRTKELAKTFIKLLKTTPATYRKRLSELRKSLNLVETTMSQKTFADIDYEKVPSLAGLKYRSAFYRNDEIRYAKYLEEVKSGTKKINAGVLYPYEILETMVRDGYSESIDVFWNNLANYIDTPQEALVVADVSGSMSGRPLNTAISLAIYIAERNKSPAYKNKFITFSSRPRLQIINGSTLQEKFDCIDGSDWGMSTDVNAVFDLILKASVKGQVPAKDMVKKIFLISDMQFNECGVDKTNYEKAKEDFAKEGYALPQIVFWNVRESSISSSPVGKDEYGTMLVSGSSPAVLKSALNGLIITPYQAMLDIICGERYERVSSVKVSH